MPKKPRKRKTNGRQPVSYNAYFVLDGGRDPALAEAAKYYNNLKEKGLISPTLIKLRGGPSTSTVRNYASINGTKRPNATTFFAFLSTLPGVKGYDIRRKILITGE
jgi:hypothetical protein